MLDSRMVQRIPTRAGAFRVGKTTRTPTRPESMAHTERSEQLWLTARHEPLSRRKDECATSMLEQGDAQPHDGPLRIEKRFAPKCRPRRIHARAGHGSTI